MEPVLVTLSRLVHAPCSCWKAYVTEWMCCAHQSSAPPLNLRYTFNTFFILSYDCKVQAGTLPVLGNLHAEVALASTLLLGC